MCNDSRSSNDSNPDETSDRLERTLMDIDTQEFLKGHTLEEIESGHSSDTDVSRQRKAIPTRIEGLIFEPGIQYKRLPSGTSVSSVSLDMLAYLSDVKKGARIAFQDRGRAGIFREGENVTKTEDENGIWFIADTSGKVVIEKDRLSIISTTRDRSISIRVSSDGMTAAMDCSPARGEGSPLTLESVYQHLEAAGVVAGRLHKRIEETVKHSNAALVDAKDVEIAQGTPPSHGKDGRVECAFEGGDGERTVRILPDGRIDYKGSASIPMATAGELLAEIVAPTEGAPGLNVFGKPVSQNPGKTVSLIPDKGVKAGEDGTRFFAEIDGCVLLNPPIISVVEVYTVNGDVDYSTGSIDFDGSVVINGAVREGFEVRASGDITVRDSVESARLEAGRDVLILKGIQGHGKGLISAGGSIECDFAQNARLEAHDSVIVNDFSVNSYISCNHLEALRGHGLIVGGEVYARRIIDAVVIGSPAGTATSVSVGTDYLIRKSIVELDEVITFCEMNIKKIDMALRPVLEKMKKNPGDAGIGKEVINRTFEKREELVHKRELLHAKREHLSESLLVEGPCFIRTRRTCHTDVRLRIRNARLCLKADRENVRFYEDPETNELKTAPY